MFNNKKKEPRNPQGLTKDEFLEKYGKIRHIAKICWYFGVYPDDLRTELKTLLEDRKTVL